LKEILVLSRIADLEGITVGEGDLALEIEAIAARTGESARRIRSRAEKEGGADSLVNQILEQKVISFIFQAGDIEDVAVQIEPEGQVEALDISATVPAGESSAPPDEGPKSEKPEPESS
jgi:FKBP-type peptidyl-prolyl cis-trans isomerase (trigger factor)